jgi:phenylalanyl-tRNA synthetase beta subunit
MAFQLEYFDENKTLTDEEIDKEFWKTIEFVKQKLNAVLRG